MGDDWTADRGERICVIRRRAIPGEESRTDLDRVVFRSAVRGGGGQKAERQYRDGRRIRADRRPRDRGYSEGAEAQIGRGGGGIRGDRRKPCRGGRDQGRRGHCRNE